MSEKKIFVSRDSQSVQALIEYMNSRGVEVEARPLIRYEAVEFEIPEANFEWVFFSSRNAVHFFFTQKPPGNHKYGAIGPGTASELSKYVQVDFEGRDYDTGATASNFSLIAGESKVLFPCSHKSLRTVQQSLPSSQVLEIICYQSFPVETPIGRADAYVVLSPENARALLKSNETDRGALFFVLGESTADTLRNHDISRVQLLPHGDSIHWAHTIAEGLFSAPH